jgi:CheY-like chemotaxis protein
VKVMTVLDPIPMEDLKHALRNLYDPARLGKSSLLAYLAIPQGDEAVSLLRRKLVDAIHSLKPRSNIPHTSKIWRIYNVLTYRYIEQLTQKQVAADMGLVIRQLRRLENDALQTLAGALAAQKAPEPANFQSAQDHRPGDAAGRQTVGNQQELDWLKQTTPCETFEIVPFVENILRTVTPLLENLRTEVIFIPQPGLPPLFGQGTSIRQALISVLASMGQCAPGGRLSVRLRSGERCVYVGVEVTPVDIMEHEWEGKLAEAVSLARRLLELSGGEVEIVQRVEKRNLLAINLVLPAPGELLILALDDNLDALRLMERYLAGSCYRLLALQDPAKLVATSVAFHPDMILLDVMLPDVDGWELLGRLREHPALGSIPVIVSTILPQESLALALGAAAFLRKPVSQDVFLKTIDRLVSTRH